MNKQQLASKIWDSANKMRSKIEANEYKDYILGFMFYKFLSDKELKFLKENDFTEQDIKDLTEKDSNVVKFIQQGIGYFIAYDHLYSTWLDKGSDFSVIDVRAALSAFGRLINKSHEKVFKDIFKTLDTGLSKLGENAIKQTKAISDLLYLIKDIPMDNKQDYDVLGFIYEYLIGSFAANAGKKAGEFYTPHEVSLLMSEIIANHLHDKEEIKIYDPTSGSGSLLINIGESVAKHMKDSNNIKYYAQELKENTYNLTRMNLVMRGILPDNIVVRNADTLEDDWPYFDESDPVHTYEPLYVDAVVSNPPYSQAWDPKSKENDPRYARYGLAPKTKADFAFLLHDLYHLKPDGIMTIVLPHGVLFRGGEEERIRKNLIENNNIDAIIGLPANIFFGTGIPTVVIVLRQKRSNTDVLVIDASKGFLKVGKNNVLQASDIKKIVSTVNERQNIEKYSAVVSLERIREEGYNLNIPRYVDSSDDVESWDIYATMFGGIPNEEVDQLHHYWKAFPSLKNELFQDNGTPYLLLKNNNIKEVIINSGDITQFTALFVQQFNGFHQFLKQSLVNNMQTLNVGHEENRLSNDIFKRLAMVPLVNKYQAYQLFYNEWKVIEIDLEMIQTEGLDAIKKVDPNIVIKKKDGKDSEVQEGWIGHILPFELVQSHMLKDELQALKNKEQLLVNTSSEIEAILDSLTDEEKDSPILNDANDAFVAGELNKALKEIYADIETEETKALSDYIDLLDAKAKKPEKEAFIRSCKVVSWHQMEANNDGTYGKGKVIAYLRELQSGFEFPEDSFEYKLAKAAGLLETEKTLKSEIKKDSDALHNLTKTTIESLSDEDALKLIEAKWVDPIVTSINTLPNEVINALTSKLTHIVEKYAKTYTAITEELSETEEHLADLMNELTGNEFDMDGIAQFQKLLRGEPHE